MIDPQIKYYPVGNGDTSLISLSDETKIIIDINITENSENDSDDNRYNVREDLLNSLNRDQNDIPYTDAFILTHPDQDHVRGFDNIFYLDDPSQYKEDEHDYELIRIDELWFTPRVFNENNRELCLDAQSFKKEADRRIKLFKENKKEANKPGNRIRVIGYTDNDDLKGLEEITTPPGTEINLINGITKSDFSFFIHAPHKVDTDENDDRNDTSLVLQARFDIDTIFHAGKALFGGDAGWRIWALILRFCRDENIEYDLFLAPHHCSWGFFNDVPYEKNSKPMNSSIEILQKGRENACIISSSKVIIDNDDNPPHFMAKKEYEKEVGSANFLVTSENYDEKKPLPIIFRVTANGPQKIDSEDISKSSKSGLIGAATSRPKTYG